MSLLWRDTGKTIRFLGVDGRAAVGVLLVIFHISLITLAFSVFLIGFFAVLERFDYTVPNAFRKLRNFLAGKRRPAVAAWRKRGYRSF